MGGEGVEVDGREEEECRNKESREREVGRECLRNNNTIFSLVHSITVESSRNSQVHRQAKGEVRG